MVKLGTSSRETVTDEWVNGERSSLYQWIGQSEFEEDGQMILREKECYEEENEFDLSCQSAEAKALPQPGIPSKQEYERHLLTHMPYRTWCEICVKSKGKARQSRRVAKEETGVLVLQKSSDVCISI